MSVTYQTKNKDNAASMYFDRFAEFFGRLERALFVDQYIRKLPLGELKKSYISRHQITARQFNSINYNLKGKVSSLEEIQKDRIGDLRYKIDSVIKWLDKKLKQKEKLYKQLLKAKPSDKKFFNVVEKYRKLKFSIHHKKRRLRNLGQKLDSLKKDIEQGIVRICFGSKKLFKAQHYLEENDFKTFAEWLKAWRSKRNSQFFVVGSKDETFGNQSCTYDKDNALKLRVANELVGEFGKYVTLSGVIFPYGQEHLDKAKEFRVVQDSEGKKKKEFQAISYRFVRKNDAWYINASLNKDYPASTTRISLGAIGVDVNAGFIVAVEIDRFGNPLKEIKYPIGMYNRSSEQVAADIGNAVKELALYAKKAGKPIIIEDLDFGKKKKQLRETGAKYSRMLSGFTYSKFKQILSSRAGREGVEVIPKSPFATSMIGHFKFMARYGLSSHGAAACAIARKGLGLKLETPVSDTVIELPKFKRNTKVSSRWSSIAKKLKQIPFGLRLSMISADR